MLSDALPWAMALALLIATVTFVAVAPVSAETLEVFAGQDKRLPGNIEVVFNDASLVRPSPPDPLRTYTYAWDFDASIDLDGDGIGTNDNETTLLLTAHTFPSPGMYTATLWVYDSAGNVANDTCMVTIIEDVLPTARIVSISPNQTTKGDNVAFDGSGTDPDGSVVGYSWWSDKDGFLSDNATFDTTSLSAGVHTIEFSVLDDKGFRSEPVTATIEVKVKYDRSPTLVVLTNRTRADTGTVVEFKVRYTDADGDLPTLFVLYYGRNMEFLCETLLEVDDGDQDCTDGKDYHYKTKLKEPGNYSYYFEFKDPGRLRLRTNERSIEVRETEGFIPGWGLYATIGALILAVGIKAGASSRRLRLAPSTQASRFNATPRTSSSAACRSPLISPRAPAAPPAWPGWSPCPSSARPPPSSARPSASPRAR